MNESLEAELRQLSEEILAELADPTRLQILYIIATGPKSASELAGELDLNPPSVLRHVKVLQQAGLILASFIRGETHYEVADDRLLEALGLVRGVLRDGLYRRAEMAKALAAP